MTTISLTEEEAEMLLEAMKNLLDRIQCWGEYEEEEAAALALYEKVKNAKETDHE